MKNREFKVFPVSAHVAHALDIVAEVGRPLIAGGAVRDWLLGLKSKDLDVEVFNCSWDRLLAVLKPLGRVDLVGKSFGVAKLHIHGDEIDFALPRSEIKTAKGHKGFSASPNPDLDPGRAALRRDFTINSISYDWKTGSIVDYLNGVDDLKRRRLRHSGPAFVEDPLRVLRGFQFCGRFELEPDPETIALCRSIKSQFNEIPVERIWMEWEKWALRSIRPSTGLYFLKSTGWLEHFPWLSALDGCPQDPQWHPEGDVLVHTCHCVDALVASGLYQNSERMGRLILMFATLTHDIGKPETTEKKSKNGVERWVSPRHDQVGIPLVEKFLTSIGAPHAIIPPVQALVGNHMASITFRERPTIPQVRRLARRVLPASLEQLFAVIRADQAGRPPSPPDPSQSLLWLEEVAREQSLHQEAPKPIIMGRHLIERGFLPGPAFKLVLQELFEMQLDGVFDSVDGALPYLNQLCDKHLT